MTLRVIDLFCGPGGFSTGFEAAGFETVAALDHDADAVETFSANHTIDAVKQDLRYFDYSVLPEADIVIGGPPCTQFSSAKSNKTRNVLDGILLVQSFLRCVYLKKPKYWIMENVPTIQNYLPKNIPLRSIGIDQDGDFYIPTKVELLASDFGVPQKRRRYLIGNFPVPSPTHFSPEPKTSRAIKTASTWPTMGHVLSHLPDPMLAKARSKVRDPNYDIEIRTNDLTDHFYDSTFNEMEERSIRLAKTQHPYMGKMAWPDRTDRPARTVVSTQLGRETLVLKSADGNFRRATVRECASFQSFPITFQFFGKSYNSKYKQAGNAVPPRLSYSLAKAISDDLGLQTGDPLVRKTVGQRANEISPDTLRKRRKPNFKRKANFLLPAKEVRGSRCELFVSEFTGKKISRLGHEFFSPVWNSELVLGEGANSTIRFQLDHEACALLTKRLKNDLRVSEAIENTMNEWERTLNTYNDGGTVYASYVVENIEQSPLVLTEAAKTLVESYLPSKPHHETRIDCSTIFPHQKSSKLRVRVLVGCLMARMAVVKWASV